MNATISQYTHRSPDYTTGGYTTPEVRYVATLPDGTKGVSTTEEGAREALAKVLAQMETERVAAEMFRKLARAAGCRKQLTTEGNGLGWLSVGGNIDRKDLPALTPAAVR